MKKATLLFETILAFIIMSVVFILASNIYTNMLYSNSQEFETTTIQADLFATKLFIDKQLQHGVLKDVSSDKMEFYRIDNEAFLQDFYSGVASLDKSSSKVLDTPKSETTKLDSSLILFNDSTTYELTKSSEDNKLYFKNNSPKEIFEHYKIIKDIATIYLQDNNLYFNSNLLQDNITSFNATKIGDFLHIDICIKNSCQKWVF